VDRYLSMEQVDGEDEVDEPPGAQPVGIKPVSIRPQRRLHPPRIKYPQ
jgi:hypothetical protein